MILGALVSVPIAFLNMLNEVAALFLISGADYLSGFGKPQLDALALLFIAGVAYLVTAFATLIMPRYAHVVGVYGGLLEIADVPIILWLAVWGARAVPDPTAVSSAVR